MDYKSKRWRRLRREVLRRDRDQCRECRRYGRVRDAVTAHHVFPAEDYPELAWYGWNLIGLCAACHDAMHDRVTGRLTAAGLAWQRRVSPPPSGPGSGPLGDRRAGPFPTAGTPAEGVRGHVTRDGIPPGRAERGTRPQTARPREAGEGARPAWTKGGDGHGP